MEFGIKDLRRELDLSLDEFARRVGLTSKSRVSEMENSGTCSLPVALAIERLSEGRIDAATLNADVAAARRGVSEATDHDDASAPLVTDASPGNRDEISQEAAA